jgi:hypothetical protein
MIVNMENIMTNESKKPIPVGGQSLSPIKGGEDR